MYGGKFRIRAVYPPEYKDNMLAASKIRAVIGYLDVYSGLPYITANEALAVLARLKYEVSRREMKEETWKQVYRYCTKG